VLHLVGQLLIYDNTSTYYRDFKRYCIKQICTNFPKP